MAPILLSLFILALSFPCRASTLSAGHNLSIAATPALRTCDVGAMAGCRLADLQPELEAIVDPSVLAGSPPGKVTYCSKNPRDPACCGKSQNGKKYVPCVPQASKPARCNQYCRNGNGCDC
ncbi:uncharacterized protein J3R85_019233 [Psidium guajava]|nr:uncharacterized protein J3R85_019233 [Psidium guajava]